MDHPSYKRIKKVSEKVNLVECLKSQSEFIIKQLCSVNEIKNYQEEIHILSSCKHQNIIEFKEIFKTDNGKVLLVMEYAKGNIKT